MPLIWNYHPPSCFRSKRRWPINLNYCTAGFDPLVRWCRSLLIVLLHRISRAISPLPQDFSVRGERRFDGAHLRSGKSDYLHVEVFRCPGSMVGASYGRRSDRSGDASCADGSAIGAPEGGGCPWGIARSAEQGGRSVTRTATELFRAERQNPHGNRSNRPEPSSPPPTAAGSRQRRRNSPPRRSRGTAQKPTARARRPFALSPAVGLAWTAFCAIPRASRAKTSAAGTYAIIAFFAGF